MPRFCAIIPFYQDKEAGMNLMEKLNEMNCPQVWCDGRFKEFQQIGDADISTDGLRELIQANSLATLIETPGLESNQKVTAMFAEAARQKFQYCFLFGCDEVPEGDFDTLLNSLPEHDPEHPRIFRLMMLERGKNGFWKDFNGPKERVFFRPDLVVVKESHWAYFDKSLIDGFPMLSLPTAEKGMIFYHDNKKRPKWRDEMMSAYQKARVPGERRRTLQNIVDNSRNRAVTTDMLRERFPEAKIKRDYAYDGEEQFYVMGKIDINRLSDVGSYVKLPIDGGYFIRKAKVRLDSHLLDATQLV